MNYEQAYSHDFDDAWQAAWKEVLLAATPSDRKWNSEYGRADPAGTLSQVTIMMARMAAGHKRRTEPTPVTLIIPQMRWTVGVWLEM